MRHPPPQPDRHPMHELGKRFAEGCGGLYVAGRAITLSDHQRMLRMHAKRVCEDHRAQQIAAGFRSPEDGIDCCEEDEDMGDISVTGDQYYYGSTTTNIRKYWPWLLGPILGAALALGVMLLLREDPPSIQPVDTDTNTDTVVRIE